MQRYASVFISAGERKIMNHFVVRVYFSNNISMTNS